jgi:hypothetical protein
MTRASWTDSSDRTSTRNISAEFVSRFHGPGTGQGLLSGRRPLRAALVCLLLTGVTAAACGGPGAGGRAGPDLAAELCDTIDNALQCGRAIEAHQLPGAPTGVHRTGDSLVLPLLDGGVATFVDDARPSSGEANYHTYRTYYAAIGYYLLAHYMYEGGQYVLVNRRNGQRQAVFGVPVLSPDNQRLAVANADLDAQYTPNVLQVWRVEPDGLRLEWQVRPDDWGAENAYWLGPDTVAFTRVRRCDGVPCEEPARLVHATEGWRVQTP